MSNSSSKPLLIWSDTVRSADLFYSIPIKITDPFLYAEVGSRKVAVIGVLERDRIQELEVGVEVIDPVEFKIDDLIGSGRSKLEIQQEVALRACNALEIKQAVVGPEFPIAFADYLRAGGVQIDVDEQRFIDRRRKKTATQLAGIRRAQAAADAAMAAAAKLVRELKPGTTSESVREQMQSVCARLGAHLGDDAIVASGRSSASGHDSGSGPIKAGDPVVIDIWPQDKSSSCYADMTRTFVAGANSAPEKLVEYWTLTRAAMNAVMPEVRPGASCRELYDMACEPFEQAGYLTQRTKKSGEVLDRGFYHGLGHGIGLEIHETPNLGRSDDVLEVGDVVTIEPGCYEPEFGGCRLEDLVLITEDGYELLTNFPYEL